MADSDSNIFELDRLLELIALMKEHGLVEVDLQQGDQKIRLARAASGEPTVVFPTPIAPPVPAAAPVPAEIVGEAVETEEANIHVITSPMVGTFYSKPNSDAEPYVKIGDMVDNDSTVCIVEAMKTFNEIPAEARGRIVAILVDNEEPVDHGKPLFKVDTSS
jgi:acetyl-CoA carboxylase biotin carboxyl carrier protein